MHRLHVAAIGLASALSGASAQCPHAFLPYTLFPAGPSADHAAASDFNADGHIDLAVANNSQPGGVSILLGTGSGGFLPAVPYPVAAGGTCAVLVDDFDADGRADLAAGNTSGAISILRGIGDGTFAAAVNHPSGSGTQFTAAGDFNGDGRVDVAAANYSYTAGGNVAVLVGNGDGTLQAPVHYLAGSESARSIAAADLNHDGHTDLVVGNSDGVTILLGSGTGAFVAGVTCLAGQWAVAVGDLNGDSHPDLATTSFYGSASIVFGNGDGTFQPAVPYSLGQHCWYVTLPDFDGDGDLDVLVASAPDIAPNYMLTIMRGRGDGTFESAEDHPCYAGSSVVVADLNEDGRLDAALTRDNGNGAVSVLLTSGCQSSIIAGPFSYNGHEYLVTYAPTWTLARGFATGLGGDLLTVNDAAENDWVRTNLANQGGTPRNLWIGLNDVLVEGQYAWASGEPVTYLNWRPGEPNNLEEEDYVQMSDLDGKWSDDRNLNASWPGMIYGTVERELACYADCTADGALTVADFGCFQTKFVLQDPYADCNADGTHNVTDFGCFQTKFVVGCP